MVSGIKLVHCTGCVVFEEGCTSEYFQRKKSREFPRTNWWPVHCLTMFPVPTARVNNKKQNQRLLVSSCTFMEGSNFDSQIYANIFAQDCLIFRIKLLIVISVTLFETLLLQWKEASLHTANLTKM